VLIFGCFLVSARDVGYTLPTPMARAKSERARSKTLAIDDLTQSIEQLQAFIPKLEDLGREGFPYLEGALARTELQLRECIKRAFGDKSHEFQTHRQLKLALSSSIEKKQTLTLVRNLIASLEDKKLELQGLKPAGAQDTAASPTPSKLTLVSSAVMPTQGSVALVGATPQPTATTLQLVPAPEKAPSPAPEVVAAQPATDTPAPPVMESVPAPPLTSIPPRKPIEPISSLFRTQELKPLPSVVEQSPAAPLTTAPARAAAAAAPVATPAASHDPSAPAPAPAPMVERGPLSAPAPPPSAATASAATAHKPPASTVTFSTTQEVRTPAPPITQQAPPPPPTPAASESATADNVDYLTVTKRICQRFHAVARQLRLRGEYRSTVNVEDEQDVQDLVHALLRQHFDDIGTDEWTPAYSNSESRTTFLLDHDRLAIVVKKTRAGLSRKDLTDQVRTDTERYRARGRCTQLLCFVYDPEGRIGNPRGLENELTSTTEHFTVDVVVAPKS